MSLELDDRAEDLALANFTLNGVERKDGLPTGRLPDTKELAAALKCRAAYRTDVLTTTSPKDTDPIAEEQK